MRKLQRAGVAVAAVIAVTGVAACGGSDSSSSSTASGATAAVATTTQAATPVTATPVDAQKAVGDAVAAGKKAAQAAGAGAKLPAITIGFLNNVDTVESGKIIGDTGRSAAKLLGVKVVMVSSEGDPSKAAAGITSLINQGAQAIVTVAHAPSVINQGLQAAKAKGIPVINIGGGVQATPLITAQYVEATVQSEAQLVSEAMAPNLKSGSTIGALHTPALPAQEAEYDYLQANKGKHGWDVSANKPVDLANLGPGGTAAINAILTANPSIGALWGDVDIYFAQFAQALKQRKLCGKVQTYGHQADQANLEAIRDGCGTAIVAYPLASDVYAAYDAIVEHLARKAPIPSSWTGLYGLYGGYKPNTDLTITKANVPGSGAEPAWPSDFAKFYATKWGQEFGS